MTLYFRNDGLIEIAAATTFGVHVKENPNSIGFFGTGLKYAIGIVLRLGGSVVMWRGLDRYEFVAVEQDIRGKKFAMVHLRNPDGTQHPIGMTTDVGKNWKPWMSYREMRANAQDEGGDFGTVRREPAPETTLFVIECRDLELAHEQRDKYFVSGTPICEMEELRLFPADQDGDSRIFYKGVRVGEFGKYAMFTYDVSCGLMLTEDRVLASVYYADNVVRRAYAHCTDENILRRVLAPPPSSMEAMIDFSGIGSASEQFLRVAEEVVKQKPQHYNVTLRRALARLRNFDPYEWVDPTVLEAKMLMKAEAACAALGLHTATHEIRVVDNLGSGVLGECHGQNIYLARSVFMMGTKMVAGTLYEEMVHSVYGHADETRAMQNFLIDRIMTLVEEKTGEPM